MPTPHHAPPDDPLLTPRQAAALLGLELNTLANKRAAFGHGFIPYIKLSRRDVRYRRSAVLAFIAEKERATDDVIRAEALRRVQRTAAHGAA